MKGYINYFGLKDWWITEFSEEERAYIINVFQPLGSSESPLIVGEIISTSETPIGLLSSLAGWFSKKDDRNIAYKIIKKAEEMIHESSKILDLHFLYQSKLEIYYKNRECDSFALEEAISACKKQISISSKAKSAFKRQMKDIPLPRHKGFEQLAIIDEKQNNYRECIDISKTALKQGWAGNWEKRIARCKKKLDKIS